MLEEAVIVLEQQTYDKKGCRDVSELDVLTSHVFVCPYGLDHRLLRLYTKLNI